MVLLTGAGAGAIAILFSGDADKALVPNSMAPHTNINNEKKMTDLIFCCMDFKALFK
jgi:hypothetical protein